MREYLRKMGFGAIAGVFGGILFGLAMTQLGTLRTIAGLVRAEDPVTGFVVHMMVATIIGALFGLLVFHQRPGAGETLFWGASYATFWWFLGALTLMPFFLRGELTWSLASAQAAYSSLLGHVIYGIGLGAAFIVLQRLDPAEEKARPVTLGTVARGSMAGLIGGWLLATLFGAYPERLADLLSPMGTVPEWTVFVVLGVLAGATFGLLYPEPSASAGVSLVRGTVYGFLWWLVAVVTIIPLIDEGALAWSIEAARRTFPVLIGLLLSNCVIAFLYRAFDGLGKALFSQEVKGRSSERSVGARGLQAIQWGSSAGLVGGVLFGLVLARLGLFSDIAQLVGATSVIVGIVVHLVIAVLVGILYGMLFSGDSYELISALGWGFSYGFFWWVLGSLTLMPLLLGQPLAWSASDVSASFGSLLGHLLYGAGAGVTYYWLEAARSPWWIPHEQFKEQRIQERIAQLRTASPAIWVEVVILAITLPLLVGG